ISFSVAALIFLKPLLSFFGASPEVLSYAHQFMVIILAGNVVTHTYMGMNAILRSAGHPRKAMTATLLTVLINVILNPLFIFGFKWGIRGSAAATVISQMAILMWQFYFFSDKSNFIHLKKGIYRLKRDIVEGIVSIGIAPFLLNAAACVIVVIINRQLTFYGGDLAIGAYGIINRVAFLFVMVVFGINQGMQPIAGYNYGAGHYGRVTEVLKKSLLAAVCVMIAGLVVIELFPYAIASVFTAETELINLTASGLRYVFMFYPVVAFQMVVLTFFQSIGMAKKSILLSLTRQVFFLIPLLIILPRRIGVSGVWLSMPLADLLSAILAAVLLWYQFKKTELRLRSGE
ncbi:MAG: MATE family efflux transporter, partial [Endomicrobia bacterium]|nr:MATE family efflux transporter [Endomicrobiia bacterium]